jgi:hypothetical protein
MNSAASSVIGLIQALPGAFAGAIVLPAEGDAQVVEPDQPRIRDGDAMGVAREVGEDGLRSGERPLRVDHPFAATQRRERGVEGALVGEQDEVAKEDEAIGLVQGSEPFEKQAAEETRQHAHGQEEAGLAGDPARPVWRQAAPGTMTWTCGWCVSAEPQVWSTAVRPMRAPRCLGSAAMVIKVSAAVLNRRS